MQCIFLGVSSLSCMAMLVALAAVEQLCGYHWERLGSPKGQVTCDTAFIP